MLEMYLTQCTTIDLHFTTTWHHMKHKVIVDPTQEDSTNKEEMGCTTIPPKNLDNCLGNCRLAQGATSSTKGSTIESHVGKNCMRFSRRPHNKLVFPKLNPKQNTSNNDQKRSCKGWRIWTKHTRSTPSRIMPQLKQWRPRLGNSPTSYKSALTLQVSCYHITVEKNPTRNQQCLAITLRSQKQVGFDPPSSSCMKGKGSTDTMMCRYLRVAHPWL